jgi:hypothetical protein
MKKNLKYFIFLLVLSISNSLVADTIIINQPGLIRLGDSVVELLGVDVIQITSSNVTLDLNEHIIAGGINGVVVDPNLTNIIIRNGIITNVYNDAISIGENCSSIQIYDVDIASCGNGINLAKGLENGLVKSCNFNKVSANSLSVAEDSFNIKMTDLSFIDCGGPAIELLGTSIAQKVKDIILEQITVASTGFLSTSSQVLSVNYGENIALRSITINNCINQSNDLEVLKLENCELCILTGVNMSGSKGKSVAGLSLVNTQSSIFYSCNVVNSQALNGDFEGILSENSSNNFFSYCKVLTSSATNGDAYGFNFKDPSEENVFRDCDVASLQGNNVYGFDFNSQTEVLEFNIFERCNVIRSLAVTGTTIGFNIGNASKGTFLMSAASYNSAPSGTSIGMYITSGDRWTINECKFVRNIGDSDTNSFGIKVETGVGNIFSQNFAFDNGNTAANQMNGVPNGSVTQLNPNNLNTADGPWANIVVTPY